MNIGERTTKRAGHVRLDHLVVGALDLQDGVAFIQDELGVTIPFGGEHPRMGTHNHVTQTGNDTFLEIIAVNPDAEPPGRPRWFGLDDPLVRMSLEKSPRLLAWVVNCDDIEAALKAGTCSFGTPEVLTRGELSWYFGLPADGRIPGGGFFPYLIEWNTAEHPAKKMRDAGLRLLEFEIHHPHTHWLEEHLAAIGALEAVRIAVPADGKPFLKARFDTPSGVKTLVSSC